MDKKDKPYMTNEERNFYITSALALAGGGVGAYFAFKKRPITIIQKVDPSKDDVANFVKSLQTKGSELAKEMYKKGRPTT